MELPAHKTKNILIIFKQNSKRLSITILVENIKKHLTRISLNIIIGLPIDVEGTKNISLRRKGQKLKERRAFLKVCKNFP